MNQRQHQQELEHNAVADWIVDLHKKIEPHSKAILGGIVACVVALIALGLFTSGRAAKRSDATLELLMGDPDVQVATKYPGTAAASWWLLFQGDDNLTRGVRSLYEDREEAETLLAQARDHYTDARGSSKDVIILSRANLGLGMAHEALGETEDAIQSYERTIKANESEQMNEVAQQRIDRLKEDSSQNFLTWFSEQDFAPADPSLPPELPGASSLPDLPDLDLPDLQLPDLGLGDEMEATEEKPDGGLELPEGGEKSDEGDAESKESSESSEETPSDDSGEAADDSDDEKADEKADESDEKASAE